ncbi:hypothetical protein [Paenibacillus contaminans]|nr:hypothetical protein [Paenibacillus contaminans]
MKKFPIVFCMFLITVTFTGCTLNKLLSTSTTASSSSIAASKPNESSEPSPIALTPTPTTTTISTPTTTSTINKTDEDQIFYGEWIVQKVLPNDGISTLDQEDIKAMIGKHIIYSLTYVSYDNQVQVEKPIYKVKTISEKEYDRRSFKELGIIEQTFQEVVVFDQTNKYWLPEKRTLGAAFIVKDRDTLIVGKNAIDFVLIRAK